MIRKLLFTLGLTSVTAALLVACQPASVPAPAPAPAPPPPQAAPLLAPDAFAIKMEPLGHWHVLKPKKLVYTVLDTATSQGKAGLKPVIQIARGGNPSVTVRSLENGQIKDEGQGIYTMEYTPADMVPHAFVFRFNVDGQEFVSAPVAAELARDGEEGIKVEAKGTSYVYQVRYNWVPGHAHASDKDKVKMVFEIMRGLQEGDKINWEQPFRNTFDLITDADHAEVMIKSADGAVDQEVHPVYKGKGIYEAERLFSVAEVGKEKIYDVRFSFTDPYNGAKVTHSEPYKLRISAAH
ncbi:MAG: hypothetical protein HYX91_04450 [Chloroflexi bacterium]|nr:hypothetical protein [Chloroflexota bacterium]